MIYFIQQDLDGPIKIGYTNGDPLRRLSSLATDQQKLQAAEARRKWYYAELAWCSAKARSAR